MNLIMLFQPFDWEKTLIVALIGAIVGQLIVSGFSWIKRKRDLTRKKKMIVNDLKSQKGLLENNRSKHIQLKTQFENRSTDEFTSSIFQTLHLDIYNSVTKPDLYSIFKNDLPKIVDIYKSIEFVKKYGPYWIYKDYLEKSELHLEEKKNEPNHIFYCNTHLGFINIAIKNIENNLKTIDKINSDIESILS